MPNRRCGKCRHWNKTCYFRRGECRRRAPAVKEVQGCVQRIETDGTFWPITEEDWWCGEFNWRMR